MTPHYICWLSAFALIILGFIFEAGSIDVQLYDTYFVIGLLQVAVIAATFLSIFGVIYWLTGKYGRASLVLSYLHIFLTVLVFFLLVCPFFDFIQTPEIFALLVCGFIVTQAIFIVNLIFGYARK